MAASTEPRPAPMNPDTNTSAESHAAAARAHSRPRSATEIVAWMLGGCAACVLAAVWCLMHLPRASVGTGGTIAVVNKGLPMTNATIETRYTDGTSASFAVGRVPRGSSVIPLPEGVRPTSITAITFDGEVLWLPVASHSVVDPE